MKGAICREHFYPLASFYLFELFLSKKTDIAFRYPDPFFLKTRYLFVLIYLGFVVLTETFFKPHMEMKSENVIYTGTTLS